MTSYWKMEAAHPAVAAVEKDDGEPFTLRIGIHAGPVVAGVIGHRKFAYDLWGHTVNVASRLESAGRPGAIHVSSSFAAALKNDFVFEGHGEVELKGKGEMSTCFLAARAPATP